MQGEEIIPIHITIIMIVRAKAKAKSQAQHTILFVVCSGELQRAVVAGWLVGWAGLNATHPPPLLVQLPAFSQYITVGDNVQSNDTSKGSTAQKRHSICGHLKRWCSFLQCHFESWL